MSNENEHRPHLEARLFTRRQVVTGFGAGAFTLSAGFLRACCACDAGADDCGGGKTTVEPTEETTHAGETAEKILQSYTGNKGMSYLDRQVTDSRVIDYIAERAASFNGRNCGGGALPSYLDLILVEDGPTQPLDAGGLAPNDLSFVAMIDLERSNPFRNYLSEKLKRSITPENTNCVFRTTRFLSAAATDEIGNPVIGISDSVLVFARSEGSKQDELATTRTYLVDCSGIKQLAKVTPDQAAPQGKKIDQTRTMPGRDSLINGYFNHLVGYDTQNGEKIYMGFYNQYKPVDPANFPGQYGGIQGVEYRELTPDMDDVTSTPPAGTPSPDAPNDVTHDFEIASMTGQLATLPSGYAVAGGQLVSRQPASYTIVWSDGAVGFWDSIPDGSSERRGDPFQWGPANFNCEGTVFDTCYTCCNDARNAGIAIGTGFLFGIPGCIPLVFGAPFCIAALISLSAAFIGTSIILGNSCETDCGDTFYRAPMPGRPLPN